MTLAEHDVAGRRGYPVQLTLTDERSLDPRWGIPLAGTIVRGILSIPHSIVNTVLSWCMAAWLIVGWIYILAYGRVPALAVKLIVELIHRGNKVAGYVLLMPGGYPPLEPGLPGPTNLTVELDDLTINRWWGFPLFGWFTRVFAVLPQLILLSFMIVGVILTYLVLWIPILRSGRYPEWAISFYGSVMNWASQVAAWVLLLPVPYPPLWLN